MIGVQFQAVDTLYFRDSTPYAASQTSPEHPGGQFPPHPATVVGAVRAWLARGQGWRRGPWPPGLTRVLGNGHGPDDLGQLHFDGPYLLRCGEPLFRMPAHLLGDRDRDRDGDRWVPAVALRPGPPVECDLGRVRLPELAHAGLVLGADQWLTRTGMVAVLQGGLPKAGEVVSSQELWYDEPRVGIERDDDTRTVREHMLYTSRHVRPAKDVTIGVRIGGVPDQWWDQCAPTVQLGGEGRWAEHRTWGGDARCEPPLTEILASRRAMLIALTPIDAGDERYRAGGRISGLGDATIVSACLPRVERVGGWATAANGSGPLPLRSVLPAGSTFFCEIGDPDGLRAVVERSGAPLRAGHRQRWGFGAVAIGTWEDTMEV